MIFLKYSYKTPTCLSPHVEWRMNPLAFREDKDLVEEGLVAVAGGAIRVNIYFKNRVFW